MVYGAAGSMGGAVARAFAGEGATGLPRLPHLAKLDLVANQIRAAGGAAETAQVNALDQQAVEEHADQMVKRAGRLDISCNAIGITAVQTCRWLSCPLQPLVKDTLVGRLPDWRMRAAQRSSPPQRAIEAGWIRCQRAME